jgi:hypothetical protein
MAGPTLLSFTVRSVTSSVAEIDIKNDSGAVLNQPLLIEFQFPATVLDSRFVAAVGVAQTSNTPQNMASVAGIATVDRGLSVWVAYNPNADLVTLKVVNYLDQGTGVELSSSVALEADAAIALKVPVSKQAGNTQATVAYLYKQGKGRGKYTTGSLDLKLVDTGEWTPKVSLDVDKPNSTMLEPGDKVRISWSVADGVSATLRGPLPGGRSEYTLSKDAGSDFRIDKGSLEIYAVGQATYFLDARVRDPEGENIQVVRTLFLDTKEVDKFAHLRVRPNRILRNGRADIHWAVWGVKKATVRSGERALKLTLTEQDLLRTYQGSGIWSPSVSNKQDVSLEIDDFKTLEAKINVEEWKSVKLDSSFTGKRLGLAVAAPAMALLTSDGLWIANVGNDDGEHEDPLTLEFQKATTDTPKAWLAVTALGKGFAVLRQVTIPDRLRPRDVFQLARYGPDGKPEGVPVDLLGSPSYLVGHHGLVCDLVGFGKRVYMVVERPLFRGSARYAISVRFDPVMMTGESLLGRLHGHRLLCFASGVYALNPDSGRMLRFGLSEGNREIKEAYKAADATKNRQSLIRTGLPVAVGNVLAVLDPSDFRLDPPVLSGLTNGVSFTLSGVTPKRAAKQPPEDLIYNPQKDEWTPCGRGLKMESGAVAAFRGGISERLWVIQPDGKMYTLTDASAQLFAPKYVDDSPLANLPPPINAKKVITIKNDSKKIHLEPQVENQPRLGLSALSSDAQCDITPRDVTIFNGETETFEIAYDRTDPSPITLRFGILETRSLVDYLEITLSGAGLSNISSVFKRATIDAAGTPSIADVPGTFVQHPDTGAVVIPPAKEIEESLK